MARSHQSSPDSDFELYTKCQRPVKFSTEKPDPGEVEELYNDMNDTVNQVILKRRQGIKHDKKKKNKKTEKKQEDRKKIQAI